MKKKIICTVTNDLTYDQRMIRICTSLSKYYEVELIGRIKKNTIPTSKQPFSQTRLKCFFNKGKLFYIEYNIRLLFYLLKIKNNNLICSIDLDTILAGYIASKVKAIPFVYDAHEYFPQMPEVVNRTVVRKIWETVEKWIVPKISGGYTVNQSIADIFYKKYKVNFDVVRNVPFKRDIPKNKFVAGKKILLYQGALNVGRGIEQLIDVMTNIKNAELWLAGEGDLSQELRLKVDRKNLQAKVKFLGYLNPETLHDLTPKATIGLNLLENLGLNYYYSLANKFFDYIQAGVPSINMAFPEYQRINEDYPVAVLIPELSAEAISNAINLLLEDKDKYQSLVDGCLKAKEEFIWEKEEIRLLDFYKGLLD